jgi:hypothetical protein
VVGEAAGERAVTRTRRWPFIAAAAVGLALALAPVAFQMFSRAPKGGTMIDGFKPYMTNARIERFKADLVTIDHAHAEAVQLRAQFPESSAAHSAGLNAFIDQWPAIDADMTSMLATMQKNIGHYDGVAALPPFVLFPWFFVAPGVIIAGLAVRSLVADRSGRTVRGRWVPLLVVALGVVAAPAIFQMFTRAPGGSKMIDDFKPFMTRAKVTQIQGYFLTIGSGEGDLRRIVVPELTGDGRVRADAVPGITTLNERWPEISGGMAPMIGAMSDNVGNFDAVVALPPFWLFPWFFVFPGLLVAAFAVAARRTPERAAVTVVEPRLQGAAP